MSAFDLTAKVRFMMMTILMVVLLPLSSSFETCFCAREGNHLKVDSENTIPSKFNKKVKDNGGGRRKLSKFMGSTYTRSIPDETMVANSATFNVLDFGAKGDGHTDDIKISMDVDSSSFDFIGGSDLPRWLGVFLFLLLFIILFVLFLWLCWRFCSTPMSTLLPGIEMQVAAPQVPWPDIEMQVVAPQVPQSQALPPTTATATATATAGCRTPLMPPPPPLPDHGRCQTPPPPDHHRRCTNRCRRITYRCRTTTTTTTAVEPPSPPHQPPDHL
ncbi:hypothetical protein Q3G72_016342 [Acer saccharum]|nr:hypothetical protein Q3G72_016342 [Acer saccharum]